jgi:hypothetical protein
MLTKTKIAAMHESAIGPKLPCDQRRPMSGIEG